MGMVKSIFKGKVLDINLERITLPNGNGVDLEIIRHPGGACALPLHDDGDVSLIRQYRHPAGDVIWEIPAGRIDDGEGPEACARRELEDDEYLEVVKIPFNDALDMVFSGKINDGKTMIALLLARERLNPYHL